MQSWNQLCLLLCSPASYLKDIDLEETAINNISASVLCLYQQHLLLWIVLPSTTLQSTTFPPLDCVSRAQERQHAGSKHDLSAAKIWRKCWSHVVQLRVCFEQVGVSHAAYQEESFLGRSKVQGQCPQHAMEVP